MHVLCVRIILDSFWCHCVYQLSVELGCLLHRMFGSRQLHVQRGLYGVERQLYSVYCRKIQSFNRQRNVLHVSLVFRRVMQSMHRSDSV
jgi:hypothetical protein